MSFYKMKINFYISHGKRIFDLALTIPSLVVLSPFLIIVALLVRFKLGSPVLFNQMRPGQYEKPFTILKFRTMTDERDAAGKLLPDVQRLTRFGAFLRKTSIDELPELINVLKGDMSLVGPRPLLMQYLGHYTLEQARRHEIKPGITGWAQVNGRNNVKFSERLRMDIWYVDKASLLLDLKILISTVFSVLKREGVRSDLDSCLKEVDDCGFYEKANQLENSKNRSNME